MKLFPYRKESNPALTQAAAAAYREAPPNRNTRRSQFARDLSPAGSASPDGPATADRADAA